MSVTITPTVVANRALQRVGAKRIPDGSLFTDNSKNTTEVATCYDTIRRAELRRNIWRFSVRRAALRPITATSQKVVPTAWVSTTSYPSNAIVTYNGFTYISTVGSNAGNIPDPDTNATASSFWQLYFGVLYADAWAASPSTPSAGVPIVTETSDVSFAASLATAKAFYAAGVTVTHGQLMAVSFRATRGDGYYGIFAYDSTDSTTTFAQDALGFVDAQGRRFFRQYGNDPINALWFGAIADNSTDNSTALQAWMTAIAAGFGGYLPGAALTYNYGTTLTHTSYLNIYGEGLSSALKYTGAGVALNLGTPRFSHLSDFAIFGTAAAAGGIYVRSAQQGYSDTNVRVEGFTGAGAYGRRFSSCWTGHILGGSSHGNTNGLVFDTTLDSVSAVNNSFLVEQHDLSNCTGIGVDYQAGQGFSVVGCDFSTTGTGIEIGRATAGGVLARNITILGNYFESTNGIYIGRGSSGSPAYIEIKGNYISGSANNIHIYVGDSVTVGAQTFGAGANTIDAGVTGTTWASENAVTDGSTAGQTTYLQANIGYLQAKNLVTTATTVGALGSASTKGQRKTVTDANATLTAGIGSIVAAGGANIVPVFADGTNWRIG